MWSLREALQFLHHPRPDAALATLEDRSHPAWQRLKAEELLAQQLSQLQARRGRAAYVGEVARGVIDPGAVTVALFFEAGSGTAPDGASDPD